MSSAFRRFSISYAYVPLLLLTWLILSSSGVHGDMCGCEGRYSLLMEFYNATGGPWWSDRSGWTDSPPTNCTLSTWTGVDCNGADVTSIVLPYNNLTGTLPDALGNLTALLTLTLHGNLGLWGDLPSSWSGMTQLTDLSMFGCRFDGSLPPEWSRLTNLNSLWLSGNRISGTLPSSWSSMSSLSAMYLSSNRITGPLPSEWSSGLTSITNIELYGNLLNGTLPVAWSQIITVAIIYLSGNHLRGKLPYEWGLLPNLVNLQVNMNCLSGPIPSSFDAFVLSGVSMNFCSTRLRGGDYLSACVQALTWPTYCIASDSATPSNSPSASMTRTPSVSIAKTPTRHTQDILSVSSTRGPSRTRRHSVTDSPLPTPSRSRTTSPTWSPTPSSRITLSNASASPTPTRSLSWLSCYVAPADVALSLTPFITSIATTNTDDASSPSPTVVGTNASNSVELQGVVFFVLLSDRSNITALPSSLPPFSSSTTGRSGAAISMATRGVSRSVLSTAPVLILNVTLVSPPSAVKWVVSNTTLLSSPSHPSSSSSLNWTTRSTNAVPWSVVSIAPPDGGWISADTPILTSTSIELTLLLTCNDMPVLSLVVTVPCPGASRGLAGQVTTAAGYSQIVSVLAGGASSGSSLGRVMATRSMVMCDANSAVGGGVIDFNLQLCLPVIDQQQHHDEDDDSFSSDNSDAATAARSAVISNGILILFVTLLLLLLSAVWCSMGHVPYATAMSSVFALPSSIVPVWTTTLPSTSAGAILLFARLDESPCAAGDAFIACLGALMSVAPAVCLLSLWWCKARGANAPWTCRKAHHGAVTIDRKAHSLTTEGGDGEVGGGGGGISLSTRWSASAVGMLAHRGLERIWRWRALEGGGEALKSAWVVLLDFHVLWYAALDAALLVAVAVLAVVGGLDTKNQSLCKSVTGVVIVLLVGQLIILVAVQPFTTLFSLVHGAVTISLTCISVMAQLLFIWLSSTSSSGLWLADLSAACNLIVVGVTAAKLLVDVIDLLGAARRRVKVLRSSRYLQDALSLNSLSVHDALMIKGVDHNNTSLEMTMVQPIVFLQPEDNEDHHNDEKQHISDHNTLTNLSFSSRSSSSVRSVVVVATVPQPTSSSTSSGATGDVGAPTLLQDNRLRFADIEGDSDAIIRRFAEAGFWDADGAAVGTTMMVDKIVSNPRGAEGAPDVLLTFGISEEQVTASQAH
ncbi:GP46-like surface antigen, putative [Bodo saltans]|uniref:GP46-like surface antigen, putative n=1 Tax=Bodo saltans TaxID=75058 RepID=A0A0S4JHI2_BODSA|nr:GP46-like surface antigen, putative [Bodo saltans]|eukprot:CUG89706.1 GP46-like surface antigen, putative [Bodo saltans]